MSNMLESLVILVEKQLFSKLFIINKIFIIFLESIS